MRFWPRRRLIIAIIAACSLLVFVYLPWTNYNQASFVTTLIGGHRRLAVVDDQARDNPTSRRDRQISLSVIRNASRPIDWSNAVPKRKDDVISGVSLHQRRFGISQQKKDGLVQGGPEKQYRSQNKYRNSQQKIKTELSRNLRDGKAIEVLSADPVRKDVSGNGGKCLPRHNVVFWKTHKCGSSTMQNMMFRHAIKNDLRLLLPPRTHLFDLIRRFNATRDVPRDFIERGKHFNMFAHHARFSAPDIATLMPRDSLYVTILRSPLTLYESIYSYLGLGKDFGNQTHLVKINTFLRNPNAFYNASDLNVHRRYARNPLLYDLGLEPEDMDSKTKIADTILEVQLRFHFVLISEYFDESLILLKDLMCWDFSDIIYLKLNAREQIHKTSPYTANKIEKWNYGDMQLYQYFNDSFWKRVEAYGRTRIEQDVRTLRDLNARLMDRCVEEATNADDIEDQESQWHPEGINIVAYRLKASAVNDRTCRDIIKSEKPFTEEIRAKQGDYYFAPKGAEELKKWWHIEDESEKKAVKVLDAMLDRIHPQEKPP
ncbi:galactosylceramide sulfotransferase [Strongylocentrotus purpuratus]|uniref:Galactosylceramide sulfotransferase n=1 Tax=Strongylocentrotus purpuratus TaxID=7668 RepID=A0A7M7NLP0_STRPU|nr:galactosylceramide sulfotransferase [Strongylocentrotus purpuratus]XP_796022.4 galactosylceramide sulfotransferase [Strongylocentrotus purpuratus]